MIILDLEKPNNTFDCPFLEEDPDDNSLWCYLRPIDGECHGLYKDRCPILEEVDYGNNDY